MKCLCILNSSYDLTTKAWGTSVRFFPLTNFARSPNSWCLINSASFRGLNFQLATNKNIWAAVIKDIANYFPLSEYQKGYPLLLEQDRFHRFSIFQHISSRIFDADTAGFSCFTNNCILNDCYIVKSIFIFTDLSSIIFNMLNSINQPHGIHKSTTPLLWFEFLLP